MHRQRLFDAVCSLVTSLVVATAISFICMISTLAFAPMALSHKRIWFAFSVLAWTVVLLYVRHTVGDDISSGGSRGEDSTGRTPDNRIETKRD